ncbi:MAG: MFS transporter [Verrucomicrobia bacterium]|nr:MFS transporter [Verrucomicrobiota bacterium]
MTFPSLAPSVETEAMTYSKVIRRLVPFLFLCYIAAYLDRVNVGFAKLQMQSDLKFSDSVFFFGAGIFFVGYFIFEVPSNLILERVGARFWIARIMISWGIISSLTMFVTSAFWFYLLRFLLGAAEAGFFPGIILYLTFWFPSKRLAHVVGLFMSGIALTGVIGAPISGWIMHAFADSSGLRNWQMLFLLEGLPSVLIGVLVPFMLPNGIRQAEWLAEAEKRQLEENLRTEDQRKEKIPLAKIFFEPRLLLFCFVYFCCAGGLYGIGFWLPQLIKDTGVKDPLIIGLLTIIPYGLAAVAMIWFGWSSDRNRERRWHFATAALLGAVGLVFSAWFAHQTVFAIAGLSLGAIGVLSTFPLFWPMPAAVLSGSSAAAGIALVNSVGNLGGFVLPFLVGWLNDMTKRSTSGLLMLAGTMTLAAVLILMFVPATREQH